mmetsp:Transcript_6470/g.9917  ORF Transcript_6470/g.9917 Transcript_6470/m.9917 type:complete len:280 (+) Transcript_6470:243-1082(+)
MSSATVVNALDTGQPQPNDVLLGRASRIYNHPGNIRYRCFINANQKKYHACKTRLDKMIFIRNLTKEMLDDGRVKFWRLNKKNGEWKVVDFRTCQDKISHALRDSKGCVADFSQYGVQGSAISNNKPPSTSAVNSAAVPTQHHVAQAALEARAFTSLKELQEMKNQLAEKRDNVGLLRSALQERQQYLQLNESNHDKIDMIRNALQQRQRNIDLHSMSALNMPAVPNVVASSGSDNQALRSFIRDLPQLGLPPTTSVRPNHLFSEPSLLDYCALSSYYN